MSIPDPVGGRSEYVRGEHLLRADLEVYPDATYSCPISDIDAEVEDVRFTAMDDECRVDLRLSDGGVVRATDELRHKECFCSIFHRLDVVPHYEGIEDGAVVVSTYLESHDAVRDLIDGLRRVSETVRLARLTAIADDTGDRTVILDMRVLTEKQREALELAVARGYYDGEDIDLSALAEELDISAAALSRRLRRAQANLASELVG
ncbi:MAG: helix-turn-helix domain-containing protein [Halanaeroarchaeum sp.]